MALALVARLTAREGAQDRVAELLGELSVASRAEPGNIHYIAHRDPDLPRVFVMYELYRDEAALDAHGETEHFQRLAVGELFDLLEDRHRQLYETLD
jgi:quinol monooxygenase YgiN